MDIHAVRVAIANQITAQIPAPLTAIPYVPDMATEPMVWLKPAEIKYDQAYGPHGFEIINFEVVIVVSRSDDQASQYNLDQYIHGTGALSVKRAIESGREQYGGTAYLGIFDDVQVDTCDSYQYYILGDQRFLGASWKIRVIGKGTI